MSKLATCFYTCRGLDVRIAAMWQLYYSRNARWAVFSNVWGRYLILLQFDQKAIGGRLFRIEKAKKKKAKTPALCKPSLKFIASRRKNFRFAAPQYNDSRFLVSRYNNFRLLASRYRNILGQNWVMFPYQVTAF